MLNGSGGNGRSIPYYMGVAGLGQIDPVSLALEISTALKTWQQLLVTLGIGAGAREADVIVPVQNKIVASVIAPVSDFLTSVNNKTHVPTCSELQTWLSEVTQAKTQWLNYLHNTAWKDGRAAQQAEATLAPYWTNATNDLNKYIVQDCGGIGSIGSIFTDASGQTNWTMIALAGVAAYVLLGKRKG
jgi:hypothetical protein